MAYGLILLFKKRPTKIWQIVVIAFGTGIAKIIMTQIKNTVMLLIVGSDFTSAFAAALTKLPATLINTATTIVIVTLLYFPLKQAMDRTFKHSFV